MQIYKNGLTAHELTETFRQIPLLQAFNDGHLSDILSASRILIYEPEELIIPEGAFGDRLYVLISGKVQVVKNHCPIVVLDQVGEVFGELSMLAGDEIRTASIFAMATTWCLELNPGFLHKLPPAERDAGHALLYRFIARIVAERLRKTTDELAQAVREVEATRRKLADLRRDSHRNEAMDADLQWAIDQLRRTKEKLARIGRGPDAGSASAAPPESLQ